MSEGNGSTRRTFYLEVIYGLWAAMAAALAIPAGIYLFFPPKAKKAGEWVDIGELTQFQPKVPEEVIFRRTRVDGWKVSSEKTSAWVIKRPDNQITAFAPQCTHLGCAYHWDEQNRNFLCPCHTSTFDLDGKVTAGPAPRPLDQYAVRVENGHLLLGEVQKAQNV
jgi:menaquinol-cytochrome c reductase iron-sulfur subunit